VIVKQRNGDRGSVVGDWGSDFNPEAQSVDKDEG